MIAELALLATLAGPNRPDTWTLADAASFDVPATAVQSWWDTALPAGPSNEGTPTPVMTVPPTVGLLLAPDAVVGFHGEVWDCWDAAGNRMRFGLDQISVEAAAVVRSRTSCEPAQLTAEGS